MVPFSHFVQIVFLRECSGVARTSPLPGHSMGTLRLYEIPREVQKLMGVWGHPPPASQVGSEAIYHSEV